MIILNFENVNPVHVHLYIIPSLYYYFHLELVLN